MPFNKQAYPQITTVKKDLVSNVKETRQVQTRGCFISEEDLLGRAEEEAEENWVLEDGQ